MREGVAVTVALTEGVTETVRLGVAVTVVLTDGVTETLGVTESDGVGVSVTV